MSRPFRVLALDGGGIRGIITARLLAALEERSDEPISRLFDLIVGTSTGGILALGLTAPKGPGSGGTSTLAPGATRSDSEPQHSAAELLSYYVSDAETIFPFGPAPTFRFWARLWGVRGPKGVLHPNRSLGEGIRAHQRYGWKPFSMNWRGTAKSRYSADGLESALDRYVGDRILRDALNDIIVPSWDVSRQQPVLFSSRQRPEFVTDARMRDVARATSAAPTYFPPQVLRLTGEQNDRILCDGGLYANNPTLIGYLEGSRLAGEPERPLAILSVGTGIPTPTAPITPKQWRKRSWRGLFKSVLDATMTGSGLLSDELIDRTFAHRPNDHYWRLQTNLGSCSSAMDNPRPENLACLQTLADDLVSRNQREIDEITAVVV